MGKCPWLRPVIVEEHEDGYHRIYDKKHRKVAEFYVGAVFSLRKAHWLARAINTADPGGEK